MPRCADLTSVAEALRYYGFTDERGAVAITAVTRQVVYSARRHGRPLIRRKSPPMLTLCRRDYAILRDYTIYAAFAPARRRASGSHATPEMPPGGRDRISSWAGAAPNGVSLADDAKIAFV